MKKMWLSVYVCVYDSSARDLKRMRVLHVFFFSSLPFHNIAQQYASQPQRGCCSCQAGHSFFYYPINRPSLSPLAYCQEYVSRGLLKTMSLVPAIGRFGTCIASVCCDSGQSLMYLSLSSATVALPF